MPLDAGGALEHLLAGQRQLVHVVGHDQPATIAAPLEPSRPRAGSRSASGTQSLASWRSENARTQRLVSSTGRPGRRDRPRTRRSPRPPAPCAATRPRPSRRSRARGLPTSRAPVPGAGAPSGPAPPARPAQSGSHRTTSGTARARCRGPSGRGRSARTRAARPRGRRFSTPATQAAEAGSQKTPSLAASQRCASRISRR